MAAASRCILASTQGLLAVSGRGTSGGEGGKEGMTEVIQEYREVVGEGDGFEGSGGRWMPRGWHDFKRFAGGVNINLGK